MTAPLGQFGTGFLPDEHLFPRDLFPKITHATLLGAPALDSDLPPGADNSPLIDLCGGIKNQGNGDACTGEEFSEAFGMSLAGQGYAGDKNFSPRFAYRAGRRYGNQLQGLPPDAPLPDAGCTPSFLIAAALKDGVVLESVCPYDATKLENDQETLADAVDGAPRAPLVVSAFTAIEVAPGPDLLRALRQAIVPRGGRVSLAVNADAMQIADGGMVLTGLPVAKTVNHMLGACAYFTVTDVRGSLGTLSNGITVPFQRDPRIGDVVFLLQQSWGVNAFPNNPLKPGCVLVDGAYNILQSAFQYLVRVQAIGARS